MIHLKLSGLDRLIKRLNPAARDSAIRDGLTFGAYHMQNWIQTKRLSGPRPQFLGVVTNRLRSSIAVAKTEKTGNEYIAKIGTNVVYGAIHEFGGYTGRGGAVYIKPRPFLRPALEDKRNKEFVLTLLKQNIQRALEK